MTLDQEFAQYQGQSVLVPGEPEPERGQCVQWADFVLRDVYNLPYHYGNAIDWWFAPGDLLNHFDQITDGSIRKGDFVIFNTQVGSVYGHIDVAMQDGSVGAFQGSDSNWGGNLTVHLVQHNNANYIFGSLRLKGADMDKIDVNLSRVLSHGILARNGLKGRAYSLDGSVGDPWVGGDLTAQFIMDLFNSPEAQEWRDSNKTDSVNGINAQLNSIPALQAQIASLQAQLATQGYKPVGQLYEKG